jgi:23S rRNA (cytosine1962-C5)-methyltransferase
MSETRILLKNGREKPILNQHPWVFSGAVKAVQGNPEPGDIVAVRAHDGAFLGRGYWNPQSQIRVRMLTWEDEPIDEAWWARMLRRSVMARESRLTYPRMACRLVNAESDFLPGLVVDRYADYLVLQALTLGIDRRKQMIAALLAEISPSNGIYERSDVEVREKEGLNQVTGLLHGKVPPRRVVIDEDFMLYVDILNGHKTGYYLDQAPNRALIQSLSQDCRVLNLFSYTGGFGLAAVQGGAEHVINVDSSEDVLELARQNTTLNEFPEEAFTYVQADVFDYLRDAPEQYDIVVLDPPKFAHSKGQIDRAARGYKDINLNALNLVETGGYLLTFSCSGLVSADLFQKIVFGALADSGRQAQVVQHLGPGTDHPVALSFPEGAYLKGLLLRVY